MSTFKDMVAEDLDIFINADEFAETHQLNDTKCLCIIQSPSSEERAVGPGAAYDMYRALSGVKLTIHVKTADLPELPHEGDTMTVDGEYYRVAQCIDDMGILTITLEGTTT